MTAPDRPEPICGPSCTPDCGAGHCYLENGTYRDPEHARGASEQAGEHALRDRIADVLRRRLGSQLDLFPHAPEFLAEGAMAEVQPVLDRQAAEIARLQALACPGCMAREQERDSWAEATRQTGIKAEEYKRAIDRWQQRAEVAERELATLRAYHQQIGDL